ncbi:MAG: hypothetical protein M4579_005246 [Chaenotheca gracillima]|nr:MAG: hypothetical protein M4579_005246 [Chaenotheca gracillima]
MPVELYACGFNAYGQLNGTSVEKAPTDLLKPELVLSAKDIRVLYVGWADSLLEVDGQLLLRGAASCGGDTYIDSPTEDIVWRSAFGDHTGLKGLLSEDGDIYLFEQGPDGWPLLKLGEDETTFVSIAGNGKIDVVADSDLDNLGIIDQGDSFASFMDDDLWPSERFHLPTSPTSLVSNEISFTAVLPATSTTGPSVFSWGDPRYSSLGRLPDASKPASSPHPIDHLGGIEILKVSSGGYMTAALSSSHDLYIWGGRPGEEHHIKALPDVGSAEVALVDICGQDGEPKDIQDVAVGGGHILVLDEDGTVWGVGRNDNGQLGIDPQKSKFVDEWTQLELPCLTKEEPRTKRQARSVFCSPWSSFVFVDIPEDST